MEFEDKRCTIKWCDGHLGIVAPQLDTLLSYAIINFCTSQAGIVKVGKSWCITAGVSSAMSQEIPNSNYTSAVNSLGVPICVYLLDITVLLNCLLYMLTVSNIELSYASTANLLDWQRLSKLSFAVVSQAWQPRNPVNDSTDLTHLIYWRN